MARREKSPSSDLRSPQRADMGFENGPRLRADTLAPARIERLQLLAEAADIGLIEDHAAPRQLLAQAFVQPVVVGALQHSDAGGGALDHAADVVGQAAPAIEIGKEVEARPGMPGEADK